MSWSRSPQSVARYLRTPSDPAINTSTKLSTTIVTSARSTGSSPITPCPPPTTCSTLPSTCPYLVRGAQGSFRNTGPAERPPRAGPLGVVLTAELRCLRLTFVPGFLEDRRDIRVGDEILPARRIPVEE